MVRPIFIIQIKKEEIAVIQKKWMRIAAAAGIVLCMAGCGAASEKSTMSEEMHSKDLSINGEISWSEEAGWIYYPREGSDGSVGTLLDSSQESVTVYRYDTETESSFSYLNDRIDVLKQSYYDPEVVCLVDMNTAIDAIVYCEFKYKYGSGGSTHDLYLLQDAVCYRFSAQMGEAQWDAFLEDLLLDGALTFDGSTVCDSIAKPRFSEEGVEYYVHYGELYMPLHESSRITSFEKTEDEVSIRLSYEMNEDSWEETVAVREADIVPNAEEGLKEAAALQERFPEMFRYEVYPRNDDKVSWDYDIEGNYGEEYRILWEETGTRCWMSVDDIRYEIANDIVTMNEHTYSNMLYMLRHYAGYYWDEDFSFIIAEDGSTAWNNYKTDSYCYEQLIDGEIWYFAVEEDTSYIIDEDIDFKDQKYRITVSKQDEEKPVQVIDCYSAYAYGSFVEFEDFNADYYPDLTLQYYYGANGGSASHYVYDPQSKCFLKLSDELSYYGFYSMDPKMQRLYMHEHGSAITGTETTYRFTGVTDYFVEKKFTHTYLFEDEQVQVTIIRNDNGVETVLSDYAYDYEEYDARLGDIWGTYWEDFIWEQEVTVDGETYILRYAENWEEGLAIAIEKGGSGRYSGRLYVYREDTYLVRVMEGDIGDPWSRMEWVEKDDEKYLVIHYKHPITGEESGSWSFPVSAFKKADWDPISS